MIGSGSAECTVNFPSLRWRSAVTDDGGAWAELIARTAAVEKPVWFERRPELEQIMESRKNPPEGNTVLGFGPDGVARAYARITKNPEIGKAYGFGCVDPAWQRRGVGSALLEWLEEIGRASCREGVWVGAGGGYWTKNHG